MASPRASSPAVDAVLPAQLGRVELHTFEVGRDILDRLASHLEIGRDQVEVRNASDHGARFVQMYAVRAAGIAGTELLEGWAAVAYPEGTDDATVERRTVGGRTVTVVSSPTAAPRLGTHFAYRIEDTLIVVQAFEEEVAAEALAALP